MNGIDHALTLKIVEASHCPDPRCVGRYRPMHGRAAFSQGVSSLLDQEGTALGRLRDFLLPARGSRTEPRACC